MSYDYTQAVKTDVVRYYRRFQSDFPQRIGSESWHKSMWEFLECNDDVTGGIYGYKGLDERGKKEALMENLDDLIERFSPMGPEAIMEALFDVDYWDYLMRNWVLEEAIELAAEELLKEEAEEEAVELRMELAF